MTNFGTEGMTVQELINALEKVKEEHGSDIKVTHSCCDGTSPVTPDCIRVERYSRGDQKTVNIGWD